MVKTAPGPFCWASGPSFWVNKGWFSPKVLGLNIQSPTWGAYIGVFLFLFFPERIFDLTTFSTREKSFVWSKYTRKKNSAGVWGWKCTCNRKNKISKTFLGHTSKNHFKWKVMKTYIPCEFYTHPKNVEGTKKAPESLKTAFKNLQKIWQVFGRQSNPPPFLP